MHKTIDSAGIILGKSCNFYKEHWVSLMRLMLGYAIIYIALFAIFVGLSFAFAPLTLLIEKAGPWIQYSVSTIVQVLAYLIQIGIGVYFAFSLPKFLHDLDTHKKASVMAALESVIPRFWDFFFVSLFFSALISGGFIVLIVPAIYFFFGTMFYPYIATLEHKKGIHALVASYWDTHGKKWALFWRSLFIGIVIMVVMGIVVLAFALLITITVLAVKAIALKIALIGFLSLVMFLFVVFVFIPFCYIPQYMLYKSVKAHTTEPIDHAFQKSKEKKFKIFIGIGFAVIVLFIISSALLASFADKYMNVPKQYDNTLLMYSVSYPGQYFTKSTADANPAVFINLKKAGDNVVIAANDGTEVLDEEMIVSYISGDARVSDVTTASRSTLTVGGQPAKDVVVTTSMGGVKVKSRAVYMLLKDGWNFLFFHTCTASDCDDEGFEEVLKGTKFN